MTSSSAVTFYRARVFHARLRPFARRFRYRVLSMLVDIDRLDERSTSPSIFSIGKFNILSFEVRDHGPRDGASLRPYVESLCANAGVPKPASILLLCAPRILGYVFNPLSVYFCLDVEGRVAAIVYEVRNTFGESHCYVAPAAIGVDGRIPAHECNKGFYVSPFIDMDARYRFVVQQPDDTFALRIIERDAAGVFLTAIWRGERVAPATRTLLRCAFDTPLAGFKILAAIHWQALFLWRGGLRLRPRPPAPSLPGLARVSHPRTST